MSAVVIDLAVERSRRLALKVAVISSSSVAVDRWLLVDGTAGADGLLAPLADEPMNRRTPSGGRVRTKVRYSASQSFRKTAPTHSCRSFPSIPMPAHAPHRTISLETVFRAVRPVRQQAFELLTPTRP
jgi:hypothetical protein